MEIELLRQWFLSEKRDLPWRQPSAPNPYFVWVSEIMLQQTQVAVVVPFFERWIQAFPTIESLACSPLDTVIKMWEGLGYYARARNLHAGARYIVDNFGSQLPSDPKKLAEIKGLGPYTISAVRAFAFHEKTCAVDGNVLRVLTRYFSIDEDIAKQKTQQAIRELGDSLLPDHKPYEIAEALIELGATVCTKKPACSMCPLRKSCKAFLQAQVDKLPYNSKKIVVEPINRAVMILRTRLGETEYFLVKKNQPGAIMEDLYEFPYFDFPADKIDLLKEAASVFLDRFLLEKKTHLYSFNTISQSFTRFRATLFPQLFHIEKKHEMQDYQWLTLDQLQLVPFSSGHKKILLQLVAYCI